MLNAILELVASDLICLLHRKDKFAEALEAEYLVKELVETYSRALPQVQASRQTADSQFQGVLLSEITKFKKSLEAKELEQ